MGVLLSELDSYRMGFINQAAGLGYSKDTVFEKLDENILVKEYCNALDNGDEIKRNQYYAALMLRYWYKIYKYKESCKFARLEDIDFIDWLREALEIAFKYRSWEDKGKSIHKDPKAIDKIINRCCFSVRGLYFQELNKDKRKVNYLCDSIEGNNEKYGDAAYSDYSHVEGRTNLVDELIEDSIGQHKFLDAIILDTIAYQDSFKENKESFYTEDISLSLKEEDEEESDEDAEGEESENKLVKSYKYKYEFDKNKLLRNVNNLNNSYIRYFKDRYLLGEDNEELNNVILQLKDKKTIKLSKYIDNLLLNLKTKLTAEYR